MPDINKLTVLFYDDSGTSFTDISASMFEFGRDSETVALESTGPDFLYLGREKPFDSVYVEMGAIVNSIAATITAEYYDDSAAAWTALPLLVEETSNTSGVAFARSGFLRWDKGIDSDDWGTVSINSVEQYWIRLQVSADITATTQLKAVNILFSDDEDLKKYHPSIYKLLPRDENDAVESTFIRAHAAARDKVMLELNRAGLGKSDVTTGITEPLNAWDVHDINQVKQAATYAALETIFFDNSDVEGDQYDQKAKYYRSEYKAAIKNAIVDLDRDDDGFAGSDEQGKTLGVTLTR